MLVQLVGDEFRAQRPTRAIVVERLLEALFIEGPCVRPPGRRRRASYAVWRTNASRRR